MKARIRRNVATLPDLHAVGCVSQIYDRAGTLIDVCPVTEEDGVRCPERTVKESGRKAWFPLYLDKDWLIFGDYDNEEILE